jgi:hypothetical protein
MVIATNSTGATFVARTNSTAETHRDYQAADRRFENMPGNKQKDIF